MAATIRGTASPLRIRATESGEQVTLPMIARHADAWNGFGSPADVERLNGILDAACDRIGRDPREIERTVTIDGADIALLGDYSAVGVDHLIIMVPAPYDLQALRAGLDARAAATADG